MKCIGGFGNILSIEGGKVVDRLVNISRDNVEDFKTEKIKTNVYKVSHPHETNPELTVQREICLKKFNEYKNIIIKQNYEKEELRVLKSIVLAQNERIKELGGFS